MRARRDAGFTLIELVVALAVLALTATLMAEGIRLALRTWDSLNGRMSRMQAIVVAQQLLRGRLSQVYPYRGTTPAALLGGTAELSFSAPAPHGAAGPLLRYRIWLADGRLKIGWRPDTPEAVASSSGAQEEALLDGVSSLAFDYFASAGKGPGQWLPAWQDRAGPPQLVRLRLEFAKGDSADWPVFVARPRLDMPVDCQFDLVSRRCR